MYCILGKQIYEMNGKPWLTLIFGTALLESLIFEINKYAVVCAHLKGLEINNNLYLFLTNQVYSKYVDSYGEFWDLGLRSCCRMRQIKPSFLGTKFVVKYWHAKHENRECCPQYGALSAFSVALAFSAVTIAVSEPFLLLAAENWRPENPNVLVPSA